MESELLGIFWVKVVAKIILLGSLGTQSQAVFVMWCITWQSAMPNCDFSIKLLCNFIEITHRHECSPVNLLHIFRTPFPKNTSRWLLLNFHISRVLISQKVKGVTMWNLWHIIFIWRRRYRQFSNLH